MASKQRKIRLTFNEHPQEKYAEAFRDHVGERGILFDYFSSVLADKVYGVNEFERGVAEGMRQLADLVLQMSISKPPVKVETNQNED